MLKPTVFKKLMATVVSIYRDVCHQQHYGSDYGKFELDWIFTNDDLISEFGLMNPSNLVRLNGLVLFCRMIRKKPVGLCELALESHTFEWSWAAAVAADLKWLCICPKFYSFQFS